MIKFGPYICWECRECAADEFGLETHDPRGLPALPGAHERIIKEFYDTIIGTQHRGEKVDEAAALDMWRALVDEYSNTSLTYIQDRYAAIGGLVAAVQQSLGWTPKWGLWTEHMFEGMYWSVAAETEVTRTGVGPTWSWLSVNGSVVHYGASENTELAIIHAETAKANLESLPTDLRDKVITVVAHPLHAQEVEDTQYGLLSQPAEWSHGDGSTSLTERIHWRLDLRDLDAHPVTECLFLPLRAGTKSPSMQGIVVSPSSAHAGFYERCGDWDILQWQKREDGASDGYRCALDIIRSLPQEALAIV
jgi:hypothetical protein